MPWPTRGSRLRALLLAADEEHVEKAFVFAGMGARNGVTSVLCETRIHGEDDIFSGSDNFWKSSARQG